MLLSLREETCPYLYYPSQWSTIFYFSRGELALPWANNYVPFPGEGKHHVPSLGDDKYLIVLPLGGQLQICSLDSKYASGEGTGHWEGQMKKINNFLKLLSIELLEKSDFT